MRRLILTLVFIVSAATWAPAQAAGFLQDLFSGFNRPSPVVYRYAPEQRHMRFVYDEALRVSRRPHVAEKSGQIRKVVQAHSEKGRISFSTGKTRLHVARRRSLKTVALTKPTAAERAAPCCEIGLETTRIDGDVTLRVGDAYMTPDGLRIYRGRRLEARERAAFVDYRQAGLRQKLKARLAAVEPRRADGAPELAQGFSPHLAAVAHFTRDGATGRTSFDPSGRVIRVVGP